MGHTIGLSLFNDALPYTSLRTVGWNFVDVTTHHNRRNDTQSGQSCISVICATYRYDEPALKCHKDLDPHLIHGSLGHPFKSAPSQTTAWSVQLFLQGGLIHLWQTHSACSKWLHLYYYCASSATKNVTIWLGHYTASNIVTVAGANQLSEFWPFEKVLIFYIFMDHLEYLDLHQTNTVRMKKVCLAVFLWHSIVYTSTVLVLQTHNRLMALCLGLPGSAGTRKVKTNVDFTEARDSEWQWHQLGHMQVCTLLQTDNMPAPHHSQFFTGRMLFLPPSQHI